MAFFQFRWSKFVTIPRKRPLHDTTNSRPINHVLHSLGYPSGWLRNIYHGTCFHIVSLIKDNTDFFRIRSYTTCQLDIFDSATKAAGNRSLNIIFSDITRAFDCAPHSELFTKLAVHRLDAFICPIYNRRFLSLDSFRSLSQSPIDWCRTVLSIRFYSSYTSVVNSTKYLMGFHSRSLTIWIQIHSSGSELSYFKYIRWSTWSSKLLQYLEVRVLRL